MEGNAQGQRAQVIKKKQFLEKFLLQILSKENDCLSHIHTSMGKFSH